MERANDKRLQELRDKGVEIYSISRLGTINNCLAEAYMTYKLHKRGDDNIYALLGSNVHDVLEGIVNGDKTEADLLPAMNEELENMDLLGIKFPKVGDDEDVVRRGWVSNMTHFCNNYKSPRGENLHTEELFIYTSPSGNYLQGYIDLYRDNGVDENGKRHISIFDYKTSSMYSKSDIKEHGYQLVVYQLGKEQEGYIVDDVNWIFLKYVTITFMGKKTVKSKEKVQMEKMVERRKIASEMAKYVEQDLYELGIDEIDAEIMLNQFKETNSFDCLPEEIRNKYKVSPCVYRYEVTDEVKAECETYIDDTIKMWESIPDEEENYKPRKFTKTNKFGKEVPDYFFCTSLCGHFKECKYIQSYLDELNGTQDKTEEDPFADLFS